MNIPKVDLFRIQVHHQVNMYITVYFGTLARMSDLYSSTSLLKENLIKEKATRYFVVDDTKLERIQSLLDRYKINYSIVDE